MKRWAGKVADGADEDDDTGSGVHDFAARQIRRRFQGMENGSSSSQATRLDGTGIVIARKSFTRNELYELVWSEPMRSLASKLSISDVGLAKACRAADIPVPPRGYWAKAQAGKRTRRLPLPPRFPGASDKVAIGPDRYTYGSEWRKVAAEMPIPPPPVFEEEMASLEIRAAKIVGRVACSTLSDAVHPMIQKLIDLNEEGRKSPYSWERPEYDEPVERRRLRILNAIFLAAAKIGCKPGLDLKRYPREKDRSPSITVGSVAVSLKLGPRHAKSKKAASASQSDPWQIIVAGYNVPESTWEDRGGQKLESQLSKVLVGMLLAAEARVRRWALEEHERLIATRNEAIEFLRREAVERERGARELEAKLAQERIDRLLAHAAAMDQAETIRAYVGRVRERQSLLGSSPDQTEAWAKWALAEADRIDPVKNGTVGHAIADAVNLVGQSGNEDAVMASSSSCKPPHATAG